MNERNIIGNKIKFLRKQKGLTQDELTAKLNVQGIDVDRPMISKIENKSREIVDYEIKGVAQALGVSIEELFGDIKNNTPK